jgi:hypothetical protein
MTDSAPSDPTEPQPSTPTVPRIVVTAGYILTGAGFLPTSEVTVRVHYQAEDVSDYLIYATDAHGNLYAELPTSQTTGPVRITATDKRPDVDGKCGFLWSNTETVGPREV